MRTVIHQDPVKMHHCSTSYNTETSLAKLLYGKEYHRIGIMAKFIGKNPDHVRKSALCVEDSLTSPVNLILWVITLCDIDS